MVSLATLQAREAKAKRAKANKVPLEKEVEKPVGDYAKSKGFWHRKFKSDNNRSLPDRVFATPTGRVFFVEFKRPRKKPTDAQLDEHDLMRKNGLEVYVIDNVEDGKRLIDQKLDEDAWY